MARINSRAKGVRGEQYVLKALKEVFGGSPWQRAPIGYKGPDLITPDDFPWAVEVKNDASVKLKHLYVGSKKLDDFWKQAETQAKDKGKEPMLVMKVEGLWLMTIAGVSSQLGGNSIFGVEAFLPILARYRYRDGKVITEFSASAQPSDCAQARELPAS